MDLVTAIKERRSIRRYTDQPIPREVLEEIVEVARFAPSWKNTQTTRYMIVDDKEKIAALATPECVYGFEFNMKTLAGASAVAILLIKENISGFEKDGSFSTPKGDRWQTFDCGIAAQTFCLAAHEKGIGTVVLGYFDDDEIKKVVPIPEGCSVGAIIPMGYPAKTPDAPPRKELEKLLTFI